MDIDRVIHDLATAGHVLPRDSMRWALEHWEEALPRFLDLIERYQSGTDRSEAVEGALFLAIHLLGDKGDPRAFPALCRFLLDPESTETVLGDAITESLCGILIRTFDGDMAPLKTVIEAESADEFVREAALYATAYLTRIGEQSDEAMRSYLLRLLDDMQPQGPSQIWVGWVDVVALLGYEDLADKAEQLMECDFVGPEIMDEEDFRGDLKLTLGDPDRMAGFLRRREIGPFFDAIETLSGWYGFTEQYAIDKKRREAMDFADDDLGDEFRDFSIPDPVINPFRHIGRNDPCPCGSGRKFKKCCLPLEA